MPTRFSFTSSSFRSSPLILLPTWKHTGIDYRNTVPSSIMPPVCLPVLSSLRALTSPNFCRCIPSVHDEPRRSSGPSLTCCEAASHGSLKIGIPCWPREKVGLRNLTIISPLLTICPFFLFSRALTRTSSMHKFRCRIRVEF